MRDNEAKVDATIWEQAVQTANHRLDPSETDWASWKCGGGPHAIGKVVVAYSGSETLADVAQPVIPVEGFWAHIPA